MSRRHRREINGEFLDCVPYYASDRQANCLILISTRRIYSTLVELIGYENDPAESVRVLRLSAKYWRGNTLIKLRGRPLWIWRSRLRAQFWRVLRTVPAIDRWANGRFACRR